MNEINIKKIAVIALIFLGSYLLYHIIFRNTFSINEDTFPSTYIIANVPENRTQSTNTGLCWAFEAMNALEATVLNKYQEELQPIANNIKSGYRFSPTHLAYATYRRFKEQANIYGYNTHKLNEGCYGEKFELSYLTGDIGPAQISTSNSLYTIESYKNNVESNNELPSLTKEEVMGEQILNTIKIRTTELIYFDPDKDLLSIETTRNKIKSYLKQGYAVALMSHSFKDICGYNSTEKSLYYTDDLTTCETAHGTIIVGWDDTYSKNKFAKTPEDDGAFIIRNSLNDNSYYYISYYDNFAYPEYVITGLENKTYDNKYSYGIINPEEYLDESIIGNDENKTKQVTLFNKINNQNELLEEVSFYVKSTDTISVYFLNNTTDNLDNIFTETNKIGEITPKETTGYFTLKLTNPINITGNSFYIGLSSNKNIITLTHNTNPLIANSDLGYKENTNYIYTSNDTQWHDTYTGVCHDDDGNDIVCVNNIQVFTINTSEEEPTLEITDKNIILDEENKIIKNIKINTPVESFQEIITTTSSYTIYDKDNIEKNSQEILKSGDYLLIGNNKYIIYVLGDIRGVGTYNKDDLKEMAKHIIDKNILTINQIYSADYNNDGLLKMDDVLNLLKELNSQNN